MKYIINYTKEGKILGFAKGDTDLNIEVSNAVWFEAQSYNKIITDGEKISFDKVDWRTPEEAEAQRIQDIKLTAQSIILQRYSLAKQSSANLGIYGAEYLETMKLFITNVVRISNEAEVNGTLIGDITWE